MSIELFLTYQKMVTLWTYAGESGTTLSIFPVLSCTHKALLRYIYACLKLPIDVFLPGPVQFYLGDLFNLERVISRVLRHNSL